MTVFTELTQTLWRQRRLLDLLTYRLEVQQLVLASGRTRWTATATAEVESVLDAIRAEEVTRAGQVNTLAALLGLAPEPTLRELVAVAPEPWDRVLAEHHQAFLEAAAEIDTLTKHNRELLHRAVSVTRDLLAALSGTPEPAAYSASGATERLRTPVRTMDRTA